MHRSFTFRYFANKSPDGSQTVQVLYNLLSLLSRSGIVPPTRNIFNSLAMSDNDLLVYPSGMLSAYSLKYFVPYGALKHSGKTTIFGLCFSMDSRMRLHAFRTFSNLFIPVFIWINAIRKTFKKKGEIKKWQKKIVD